MQKQSNSSVIHITHSHYKEIGKNFKRRRNKLGLTQAELAEKMSSDTRNIRNYESGKSLTLDNIVPLCQYLECTLEDVLPYELLEKLIGLFRIIPNMNRSTLNSLIKVLSMKSVD